MIDPSPAECDSACLWTYERLMERTEPLAAIEPLNLTPAEVIVVVMDYGI
jgi:hypothetical protein